MEMNLAQMDPLVMGGREFHSRLFIGTGKFSSSQVMRNAVKASQSEIVTVALRRVDLENPEDDMLSNIDRSNSFSQTGSFYGCRKLAEARGNS